MCENIKLQNPPQFNLVMLIFLPYKTNTHLTDSLNEGSTKFVTNTACIIICVLIILTRLRVLVFGLPNGVSMISTTKREYLHVDASCQGSMG